MSRDDYIKEGIRQLSDANFYVKLDYDPTPNHIDEIHNTLLKALQRDEITKKIFEFLVPTDCTTPTYKSNYRYIYAISTIFSSYSHIAKQNLKNSWHSWIHFTKPSNLLRNIRGKKSSSWTHTSNVTEIHCTQTCMSKRQLHTAIYFTHHVIPKTASRKAHMANFFASNVIAPKQWLRITCRRYEKTLCRWRLPGWYHPEGLRKNQATRSPRSNTWHTTPTWEKQSDTTGPDLQPTQPQLDENDQEKLAYFASFASLQRTIPRQTNVGLSQEPKSARQSCTCQPVATHSNRKRQKTTSKQMCDPQLQMVSRTESNNFHNMHHDRPYIQRSRKHWLPR